MLTTALAPAAPGGPAGSEPQAHQPGRSPLVRLRAVLADAGYTETALVEIAKVRDAAERIDTEVAQRRTADPTPFNVLARLFMLRQSVSTEGAARALAPVELQSLVDIGILQYAGDGVRSDALLLPYGDLFILSDFGPQILPGPLREDHVLSVGAASTTLANLTVRRAVASALDLGIGSGVQALLAARHARRVVGTDLNPRALRFATLNAQLNDVANVDLRQGSLYEPVEGEQFDLVVANPPFIISPERRYLYRDGGLPGDRLAEQVIRQAPSHLRDDGYAVVLFNWYHQNADDWAVRPTEWVSATGCDAWLVRFDTSDPLTYAANWLRPTEGRKPQQYSSLLDTWLRYYEQLGIGMFSAGVMFLRRRATRHNWVRADTVAGGRRVGSCGAQVERVFAAQTLLEEQQDAAALLDYALVLAPDHALDHHMRAENGSWVVQTALLRQTQGFEFTGEVDRVVAAVLSRCDGSRSLREAIAAVAQQAATPFEQLASPCCVVMRWLLQLGFLDARPVGAAATGVC